MIIISSINAIVEWNILTLIISEKEKSRFSPGFDVSTKPSILSPRSLIRREYIKNEDPITISPKLAGPKVRPK